MEGGKTKTRDRGKAKNIYCRARSTEKMMAEIRPVACEIAARCLNQQCGEKKGLKDFVKEVCGTDISPLAKRVKHHAVRRAM